MVEIVDPYVRGASDFGYGLAAGKAGISTIAPQIQIVTIGCKRNILKRGIGPRHNELFPVFYPSLANGVLHLCSPFPDNEAAVALPIYGKTVIALLLDLDTRVGQVHEVAGRVVDPENKFPELQLDVPVLPGYVAEDNIRIFSKPQKVPFTQLDFDPGIGLRNNSVTAQDRQVDGHFGPVDIARRLEARLPVNEADSGRIVAFSQK